MSNPDTSRPIAVAPWKLPHAHPTNLLIEIAILKQAVGVLSHQVQRLMEEWSNGK